MCGSAEGCCTPLTALPPLMETIAGLTVAIGALIVSVGMFMLVVKLGQAIEKMGLSQSNDG